MAHVVQDLRSHPVSSIRYFELLYEGGRLGETKRIAAVTPRAKIGKRDMAGRTRGQGETTPEPIGLDLCPHPVSKYTILWAAGTGVGYAREETTERQARRHRRSRWGDTAQGDDGTREGGGMPTRKCVFEGGALPWSGRWCREEKGNNKVQKLYLYR